MSDDKRHAGEFGVSEGEEMRQNMSITSTSQEETKRLMKEFDIPEKIARKIRSSYPLIEIHTFKADELEEMCRLIRSDPDLVQTQIDNSATGIIFALSKTEKKEDRDERVLAQIEQLQLKEAKKALLDLAVSVEKLNQEFNDAFKMIGINRITREFREGLEKTVAESREDTNVKYDSKPYGVNHRVTFLTEDNGGILDFKFDDSEEKDQQKS